MNRGLRANANPKYSHRFYLAAFGSFKNQDDQKHDADYNSDFHSRSIRQSKLGYCWVLGKSGHRKAVFLPTKFSRNAYRKYLQGSL